jgi:hypothetical protein
VANKFLSLFQLAFFTQNIDHNVKSEYSGFNIHPKHILIKTPSHLGFIKFQEHTQNLIASFDFGENTILFHQVETLKSLIGFLELAISSEKNVKYNSGFCIESVTCE